MGFFLSITPVDKWQGIDFSGKIQESTFLKIERNPPDNVNRAEIPGITSRLLKHEKEQMQMLVEDERVQEDPQFEEKCSAIKNANLEHPIFKDAAWFQYALASWQKGGIDSSELAMASLIDIALADPTGECKISSLNDPDTKGKVMGTLKRVHGEEADFEGLSPLNSLIIEYTVRPDRADSWGWDYKDLYLEKFLPFLDKDTRTFYVPSPESLQRALKAISPKHYVTVFPTFGYSKKMADFLNIPHLRTLGVDSRHFRSLERVHNNDRSTPFSMYLHDAVIHSYITSLDPYRQVESDLASYLWNQDKKVHLDAVIEFADRDFAYPVSEGATVGIGFRGKVKASAAEAFWYHIGDELDQKYKQFVQWLAQTDRLAEVPSLDTLLSVEQKLGQKRYSSRIREGLAEAMLEKFEELEGGLGGGHPNTK